MQHRALTSLLVIAIAVAALPGCGVLFVNNPKRSGLDCSRSRFWPIADFVVAAAGTGFLINQGTASDEPVTLVAPGVLLASGLWGNVKVGRCRGVWERATPEQIAAYGVEQAELRRQREAREAAEREQMRQQAAQQREAQLQAAAQHAAQVEAQRRAYDDRQDREAREAREARDARDAERASRPAPRRPPAEAPRTSSPRAAEPTVSVSRTRVERGFWRTTTKNGCSAFDWAGNIPPSKTSVEDRALHIQTMTRVCERCVAEGKTFGLLTPRTSQSFCD